MTRNKIWIETFSGKKIDPFDADPKDVDIIDIAHSLAMQCRFNGHCTEFYSVSEHCVNTAKYVLETIPKASKLTALFALLHDASEAYLCDIPRPLKPKMKKYLEWEKNMSTIIFAKFAGRQPSKREWHDVMLADNAMLSIEATKLASSGGKEWGLPVVHDNSIRIRCFSWRRAESEFMKMFKHVQI